MRVNTRVGTLSPGHVFVTPLTRRSGDVALLDPKLQVAFGEERATQEVLGVDVNLGFDERKSLHPDVLVEIAVEDMELAPPSRGSLS